MDFVFAFFVLLGAMGLTHLNSKWSQEINSEFGGKGDEFPLVVCAAINWCISGAAWVFVIWLMGHGIGLQ